MMKVPRAAAVLALLVAVAAFVPHVEAARTLKQVCWMLPCTSPVLCSSGCCV